MHVFHMSICLNEECIHLGVRYGFFVKKKLTTWSTGIVEKARAELFVATRRAMEGSERSIVCLVAVS